MACKNISILGSTGSIGTQSLDVIRSTNCAKIVALTANASIELLEEQIREFRPLFASVGDENKAEALRIKLKKQGINTEILFGIEGIIKIATLDEIDLVLNALVGNVGLIPTVEAIKCKKNIALANKETLVSAGNLVVKLAKENNVTIYPVDSEHSAIFQCLQGNKDNEINKIYLTASGGPFRRKSIEQLMTVTKQDALNHPNWSMGSKITIDSATMMNKGLEVIEAKWLYNVPIKKIEVLIHPQSLIHSMVEFVDGAIMAQLGEADMRVPIQYALTYPQRLKNNYPRLNLLEKNIFTFEKPDLELFPCLRLAFEAIDIGGTMPTVLNGANEIAVFKFLNDEIKFFDISTIIERTMSAYTVKKEYTLTDILAADAWAREYASSVIVV